MLSVEQKSRALRTITLGNYILDYPMTEFALEQTVKIEGDATFVRLVDERHAIASPDCHEKVGGRGIRFAPSTSEAAHGHR